MAEIPKEIKKFQTKYETNNSFRDYIDKEYSNIMITEYVHSSNRIENVGTQEIADTVRVLSNMKVIQHQKSITKIERETIQTKNALEYIIQLHQEIQLQSKHPKEQLYLTEPNVIHSHTIMMKQLVDKLGYRDFQVGTHTNYGFKQYENFTKIQTKLQSLIDNLNEKHKNIKKLTIHIIVKSTAKWLLEFLNIHPFADGNGRVARLWMSFILLSLVPFTVSIPSGCRDKYIHALEHQSVDELENIIWLSIGQHMKNALDAYDILSS
jgi:Fic family protein